MKEARKHGGGFDDGSTLFDTRGQEQKMKREFKQIAGEDLEVDAYELQNILNHTMGKGKILII